MENIADFDHVRRRDSRKAYAAEVFFSVEQKAYTGRIENISRGGALVNTGGMPKIEAGEITIITIPFPDMSKSVKRKAKVMWTDGETMGVQFI